MQKLKYLNKIVSYSQNLEDIKLYGYFGNIKNGTYIDVGANHPVNDSVTNFFYIRGWSGINVEPQKLLIRELIKARKRDVNLQVGLGAKNETKVLRRYVKLSGLSTLSDTLKEGYGNRKGDYVDTKTNILTLKSIITQYANDKPIHFLKVDVEGYELPVIQGNDWTKFRPWVICIEATGSVNTWQKKLLQADYVLHQLDGLNNYYVAKERADLISEYQPIVATEVIDFRTANLPHMRLAEKLYRIKNLF